MPTEPTVPSRLPASAALVLATLASGQAPAAPGGLACSATDASLSLSLRASVGPGLDAAVAGLSGELVATEPGLPADLARVRFTEDHLVSRWIVGEDLRLHVVWERDGHRSGSAELTLRTSRSPAAADRYEGSYAVTLADAGPEGGDGLARKLAGRAACSLRPSGD